MMRKNRVICMVIAVFMVMGLVITTTAMAKEKGGQDTIQGMVEKGEKGITMIKTDDGQAITILNKNMADKIGKKVKLTGTLTKNKTNKSIIVTAVEEINE